MQSSERENKRESEPERKIERHREKNYKATRATMIQKEKNMVEQSKKPKKRKMVNRIKQDIREIYKFLTMFMQL